MKEPRRESYNRALHKLSHHWIRYFLYTFVSCSFIVAIFTFAWLKVLYVPEYKEGEVSRISLVAPIDFSLSWSVDKFYKRTAQIPETFGKVYRLILSPHSLLFSQALKADSGIGYWFEKASEFLFSTYFIDSSTQKCLEDLSISPPLLERGKKILEVNINSNMGNVIAQCFGHLEFFLTQENCPQHCFDQVMDVLKGASFEMAIHKEMSACVKGELLGTRCIEKINKGKPVLEKYQRIQASDAKLLKQLRAELLPAHRLFSYRSLWGAIFVVFLVLLWGYRALKALCPEMLKSPERFMLYIAIITLSLLWCRATEIFCAYWVSSLSYPPILPFTAVLLGYFLGLPIAGFSCTFLALLYTLGSDLWNNSWFLSINLLCSWRILVSLHRVSRLSSVFWACMKLGGMAMGSLLMFRIFTNTISKEALYADGIESFVCSLITSISVVALIPVFEASFGASTNFSLLTYLSPDNSLLSRLFKEAPGTYQHSILVGSLAEAAAQAIGADSLYCLVAAHYHDIGKLINPRFFIENQKILKQSSHCLSPLECAKMIMRHIPEGVNLARQAGLPESFIRVIEEHHGTSVIRSAYYSHMLENPSTGTFDEELFRYSGNKPSTKETTIIMIADSFEAASRSLKNASLTNLQGLIDQIIHGKLQDGQFSCSPVTLDELALISKSMVQTLYGALHSRMKYPEISYKPSTDPFPKPL
ncbi:HD family phosphohydrolase [Candidatus Chlamydia corallus]|uniref:HD family phosphohydrolase n=1 Tax=Candidatus Chlamydia corallus TaxID=2038470 RepID=UPI000C2FDCD2|nr:HD family phosphohydrolase [Candidatus Chlamydia corallus]